MSTLIDTLSRHGTTTDELWASYRELLARNEYPKDDDADALREVMVALGRTPAAVAADLRRLEQARDLEAVLADEPKVAERQRQALERLAAFDRETRELQKAREQKREPLRHEQVTVAAERQKLRDAHRQLNALRVANRQLFGLPPAPDDTSPPPEAA